MIEDTSQPATPTTTPPVGKASEAGKRSPAPKKKAEKDAPGFRLDTRGTVKIQELAAELKINCADARRKLRENGIKKSLYGTYEWDKGTPEYKRVRKLLMA